MVSGFFHVVLWCFAFQNFFLGVICILELDEQSSQTPKGFLGLVLAVCTLFVCIAAYGLFTYSFRPL